MISGPKPGDETTRVHYIYDAWNRLVEVRADSSDHLAPSSRNTRMTG